MLPPVPELRPEFDRLDAYLTEWAAWKRIPSLRTGYKPYASPGQVYRARIQSFDDLGVECDGNNVRTIDALIDSLSGPESGAVYAYHLGDAWRFPESMELAYERARGRLEIGINQRGLP